MRTTRWPASSRARRFTHLLGHYLPAPHIGVLVSPEYVLTHEHKTNRGYVRVGQNWPICLAGAAGWWNPASDDPARRSFGQLQTNAGVHHIAEIPHVMATVEEIRIEDAEDFIRFRLVEKLPDDARLVSPSPTIPPRCSVLLAHQGLILEAQSVQEVPGHPCRYPALELPQGNSAISQCSGSPVLNNEEEIVGIVLSRPRDAEVAHYVWISPARDWGLP